MSVLAPLRDRVSNNIFIKLSMFFVVLLILFASAPADATDKQLITVFSDGLERTIRTKVSTVEEALAKAGVTLRGEDIVEPGLDTVIVDPTFRINVYRARPITVVDGEVKVTITSPFQSARLIAEQAGIELFPEDSFTIERVDNILLERTLGQKLTIKRSTPIEVDLYGNTFTLRTHEKTLQEAIDARDIIISDEDIVRPALSTPIKEGLKVTVVHVGTETTTIEEPEPFKTETIRDSNMFLGQTKVRTKGVNGLKLSTYEIELHDGKEQSRELIQSVLIEEPVTEVVVSGTRVSDRSSNEALGETMAAAVGWTGEQWICLHSLWHRESTWNHLAVNPSSGAYGIVQSLPASKLESAGPDWRTNPATQIKWGLGYIEARYGTPCEAWGHSEIHNWY